MSESPIDLAGGWALGTFRLDAFCRKVVEAAWSLYRVSGLCPVAVSPERRDEWVDWTTAALLEEAKLSLVDTLPKGVSFRIPGHSSDGAMLAQNVYVTVDPMDLGGPGHQHPQDAFVNIAVQIGGEVVAAYSVSLSEGRLYCVHPGESIIMTGRNRHMDDAEALPTFQPRERTVPRMFLQGEEGHDELLRLLGADRAGFSMRYVRRPHVECLLDVVRGQTEAYVRPAGEETAPWIDLPLIGFGQVGGLKAFRVEDGYLDEVPLAPTVHLLGKDQQPGRLPAEQDGVTIRDHGLLYVAESYVDSLRRHVPMNQLGD